MIILYTVTVYNIIINMYNYVTVTVMGTISTFHDRRSSINFVDHFLTIVDRRSSIFLLDHFLKIVDRVVILRDLDHRSPIVDLDRIII